MSSHKRSSFRCTDAELGTVAPASIEQQDAAYFHSYNHVGIHEEMIKDRVRTDAYRDAILAHKDAIRDKVVMDVGCGTGILSIFCAIAGAKKVYAVDASGIAVQAREVVKANNLSHIITVIVGRIEEAQIDEQVDVIISEWMGYMLLYESMLPSVIFARDRWLKPGGLMLPSHATLYMAPITNPERYGGSVDFWRNVYGIDMSAMLPLAKQCAFEEPCIECITAENVLSFPITVKRLDCRTVTLDEVQTVSLNFNAKCIMKAQLHGFAFWFDVFFGDGRGAATAPMVLSTAPENPATHWAQSILYVYEPMEVMQDSVISGSLKLSQCKENPRFLNIHLEYLFLDRHFIKESIMR